LSPLSNSSGARILRISGRNGDYPRPDRLIIPGGKTDPPPDRFLGELMNQEEALEISFVHLRIYLTPPGQPTFFGRAQAYPNLSSYSPRDFAMDDISHMNADANLNPFF